MYSNNLLILILLIIFFVMIILIAYYEVNARLVFMEETNKSLKEIALATTKLSHNI